MEVKRNKSTSKDDNAPLDNLSINIPRKQPRRQTVPLTDKIIISAKTNKASKAKKKSKSLNCEAVDAKINKVSNTKKKSKSEAVDARSLQQSGSSSAPDVSEISIDCLNGAILSKKRRSARVGMKKTLKSNKQEARTPILNKETLKRKHWMFDSKNEGYEDDIFENQKFNTPLRLAHEVDDCDTSTFPTPKFGYSMTPANPKKTRKYKEAVSPSDLILARKRAEEYICRRNEKRNADSTLESLSSSEQSISYQEVPEKKKLEFTKAMDKVEKNVDET